MSITGTDADFIVKLIDVYSGDAPPNVAGVAMGGRQQLVRAEPFRGRYRNSFEYPMPFVPDELAIIEFELPDIFHTWRRGHRLMVQLQSSYFPMIDRNPQNYVENIFTCDEEAFVKQSHRVFCGGGTFLELPVLEGSLS